MLSPRTKNNPLTTILYRVVSAGEKKDFDESGLLRTGKNTLEAKQFFKSKDAINDFLENAQLRQYYPPYKYLLIIHIDNAIFNIIADPEIVLDGYDAISIDEYHLPAFNNYITFVEQEQL